MKSTVATSIKRKPVDFIRNALAVYGLIWVLLEPAVAIVPSLNTVLSGWDRFLVMLLVSLIAGAFLVHDPTAIKLHIQNSTIEVTFGDLFQQPGLRVVPVSQYMHELEVAPSSLQAKVIKEFAEEGEGVQGYSQYKHVLEKCLADANAKTVTRNAERGEEKQYPLGTTAIIGRGNNRYLYVAVTKTELKGHIPPDNCDTMILFSALNDMWDEARIQARGMDVNIPLLGSGITGIKLSPQRILELNLLSLISAVVEDGRITTGTVRIVLHQSYQENIDLAQIHSTWKMPN